MKILLKKNQTQLYCDIVRRLHMSIYDLPQLSESNTEL